MSEGAGEPQTLVDVLSRREDLSDTEIVHILTLGVAACAEPGRHTGPQVYCRV